MFFRRPKQRRSRKLPIYFSICALEAAGRFWSGRQLYALPAAVILLQDENEKNLQSGVNGGVKL